MITGNPDDRVCPGCAATYPAMLFLAATPAALCYRCRQTKRARAERRRYHEKVDVRRVAHGATAWDQRPMLAGAAT